MIFIFAIIIPVLVSGIYLLCAYLKDKNNKRIKINDEWMKAFLMKEIIYFGAAVVLSILAAIFSFQFDGYSNQNIIVGFAFVSLMARYPVDLTTIRRDAPLKTWLIKGIKAVISLAGFFLELGLFSKAGDAYVLSGFRLLTFFLFGHFFGKIETLLDKDYEDKRALAIKIMCALVATSFLIYTFFQPAKFYDGYPFREDLEYITDVNPYLYYNVFDAFQHGQLHIRIEPNPILATLENPYDYAARHGISCLWDTAYYNGKYYSYFGIAPLFLVMYPVYILSGFSYVPNGLLLLALAVCLYGYGMFRLAKTISDKFHIELPGWFFYLFVLMAITSSLGISFIPKVWTDWKYRVPFAYANVGMVFFLYAFFEGLNDEKHRIYYWVLSAAAYVLIMGSRPEVGLIAVLVVPFLIGYIRDAIRFNKKDYWNALISFVSVLAVGGLFLAGYNFLRFGNPLEFGSNYQLTIMDTRVNKLNAQGFTNGFYHYFLQLPEFVEDFPLFEIKLVKLPNETHPYVLGMMGLVMNPFIYAFLFIPFSLLKEKKISNWLFLLVPPMLLAIFAWILYCLGGVCTRYALYLWPLATIWVMCIVISASPFISKNKYAYYAFLGLILTLVALGTFTASNFLFNTFDGLIRGWLVK